MECKLENCVVKEKEECYKWGGGGIERLAVAFHSQNSRAPVRDGLCVFAGTYRPPNDNEKWLRSFKALQLLSRKSYETIGRLLPNQFCTFIPRTHSDFQNSRRCTTQTPTSKICSQWWMKTYVIQFEWYIRQASPAIEKPLKQALLVNNSINYNTALAE